MFILGDIFFKVELPFNCVLTVFQYTHNPFTVQVNKY